MKPSLSAGESDQLTREMVQSAQAKTAQPKDPARSGASLALDTAQLALSAAGIFDPTPTCDAIDGVISLLRGDYTGAAISALSMVPYVGDLAKLGKLNKLAGVAADAADVAKALPGGDTARGALDAMRELRTPRDAAAMPRTASTRIDDLQPGKPFKEVTETDRIVEEMLQQGEDLKQADTLARLDTPSRRPDAAPARLVSTGAVTPSRNALPTDFVDGLAGAGGKGGVPRRRSSAVALRAAAHRRPPRTRRAVAHGTRSGEQAGQQQRLHPCDGQAGGRRNTHQPKTHAARSARCANSSATSSKRAMASGQPTWSM